MKQIACAFLLILACGRAEAAGDSFSEVLRPFLNKYVVVREGATELKVSVRQVGADYFCVYVTGESKEPVPRCYPFSEVRWVTTDPVRPSINIR
jgi:hypothetical protein